MENIKKVFVLSVVIAFFSWGTAVAQLKLGVRGGLNYSTITNGQYSSKTAANLSIDGLDYKPGYFAGLVLQYKMQEFAIESGAYYSVMGGKATAERDAARFEVTADPTYLQVPLTFLYKFQVGQKMFVYPSLGLQFSYGLSGKIEQSSYLAGNQISTNEKDYFSEGTNKFDWGPAAGLNFEYNKFVIGLGYEYGAKRINEKKIEVNKQTKNMHNSNFKLSVGYVF